MRLARNTYLLMAILFFVLLLNTPGVTQQRATTTSSISSAQKSLSDPDVLYQKANHYRKTNRIDSAIYWGKLSAETADSLSLQYRYSKANYLLGFIYDRYKKDFELSLHHYYSALDGFILIRDDHEIAKSLNAIGNTYQKFNCYECALDYYFDELEIRGQLKDSLLLAQSNYNIGRSLRKLSLYDSAKYYLEKSIHLYQTVGYYKYVPEAYFELAKIDQEQDETNNAINNYILSLDQYELNGGFDDLEIRTSINLGKIYLTKHSYDEAKSYLHNAKELLLDTENDDLLVLTTKYLGDLHLDIGEIDLALNQYKNCISLAPSKEYEEFKIDALEALVFYYHDKAVDSLAKYSLALNKIAVPAAKERWRLEKIHTEQFARYRKSKREQAKLLTAKLEAELWNWKLASIIAFLVVFSIVVILILKARVSKVKTEVDKVRQENTSLLARFDTFAKVLKTVYPKNTDSN